MKPNFGIDENHTKKIVNQLKIVLANTYSLYFQTLQAHWNLEDPGFFFLHEMFQKQYETLAENGDLIAERIRQMGEKITGTLKAFSKDETFESFDVNSDVKTTISHLANCHEKAIKSLRDLSVLGEEAQDFGLVDLLGGILRDHEKTAWILRSHL